MLQENKKYKKVVIALFFIGAVLLIIGFISGSDQKNRSDQGIDISGMEKKLESFILNVEGIYEVDVIITVEVFSEKDVYYSFSSNDEVIQYSRVNGVCVACTGGNNEKIKQVISSLQNVCQTACRR